MTFFDQIINQILIIVLVVLLIVLYLIVARLEFKLRKNEKEVLSLPLTVR